MDVSLMFKIFLYADHDTETGEWTQSIIKDNIRFQPEIATLEDDSSTDDLSVLVIWRAHFISSFSLDIF